MSRKQALKEHREHQKAIKPLLKHLSEDEKKLAASDQKKNHLAKSLRKLMKKKD